MPDNNPITGNDPVVEVDKHADIISRSEVPASDIASLIVLLRKDAQGVYIEPGAFANTVADLLETKFVEWVDKWNCTHTLSIESAAKALEGYMNEWPGGLEEIESAFNTQLKMKKLPLSMCLSDNVGDRFAKASEAAGITSPEEIERAKKIWDASARFCTFATEKGVTK